MSKISIVFGSVTADIAQEYLAQRIQLLHNAAARHFGDNDDELPDNQLQEYVAEIHETINDTTPPMAPAIDVSAIPGEAGEELRRRKVCMLAEVGRFFPLVDGEVATSNEVSYLTKEWDGFHANAIILKQATNFSVCYYIYNSLLADTKNNKLVEQEETLLMAEPAPRAFVAEANSIDFGDIARQMAGAMAGALPSPYNKIGTTIISYLWPGPDKAAEQWQKVYDALQSIVRKELARDRVTAASLKVKGFVSFLTNEYNPLRDTGRTPKKDLQNALAPYGVSFNLDIVNVFMYTDTDKNYDLAAATLANFMTGACLHLGLNQERALQDPNVSDPSQSGYAASVKTYAATYATYADNAAKALKRVRMEQISGVKSDSQTHCRGGAGGGCTTNYWFWFEDSNSNYKSRTFGHNSAQKDPPDSRGDAQRARDAYYNDISRQMDETLKKQVYDVIDNWKKLQTNPIPKV